MATYTPINLNVYVAAYSGAIAGMGAAGWITDPAAVDYSNSTFIAGAFAQAVDLAWNSASVLSTLEYASIQNIAKEQFVQRGAQPAASAQLQSPSNWTVPAAALVSIVRQGDSFFASATTGVVGPTQFVTNAGLLQPASLQGNIFIDPQNVSGNAGQGPAFGGSALVPLSSYKALVALWGGTTAFINQNTLITFISAHNNNLDPIVADILLAQGATFGITTTPTVVATGVVLAGTVAKNRTAGANSLLQTNLGGSGATNQLVVNTTHASVAWNYKSLGAGAFSMCQPLVAGSVPPALQTTNPAEVDTWANGDTVNLLTPLAINLVRLTVTVLDWNTARTSAATLYRVVVFDPSGTNGQNDCFLGPNIHVIESQFQKKIQSNPGSQGNGSSWTSGAFGYPCFINCQFFGGIESIGGFRITGGNIQGTSFLQLNGTNSNIDADTILTGIVSIAGGSLSLGFAALDSGGANNLSLAFGGRIRCVTGAYGGHVIYGGAAAGSNILIGMGATLQNATGTYSAGYTFPTCIATGFLLDGVANVGQSHTGASPDVINSGITTTVANLDAAAGPAGFGGVAFNLSSGALITNTNV